MYKSLMLTLFTVLFLQQTSDGQTLQDIGGRIQSSPQVTIYTAKEIITLDKDKPSAEAVAVVNGKILAVGTKEELKDLIGDQPVKFDDTFKDKIIVPGFIAQHDHPVLAALTMASEILSIENWGLLGGMVSTVKDKKDFITRLLAADKKLKDPEDPLIIWGYHPSSYRTLTRSDLDEISKKPSCYRMASRLSRGCNEFQNSEQLSGK